MDETCRRSSGVNFGWVEPYPRFSATRRISIAPSIRPAASAALVRHAGEWLLLLTRKMLRGYPGVHRREQTDDVLQYAPIKLMRARQAPVRGGAVRRCRKSVARGTRYVGRATTSPCAGGRRTGAHHFRFGQSSLRADAGGRAADVADGPAADADPGTMTICQRSITAGPGKTPAVDPLHLCGDRTSGSWHREGRTRAPRCRRRANGSRPSDSR